MRQQVVKYYQFERIDSTQRFARAKREELMQNGVSIISADEQTDGVGRLEGRRWESPASGNIYLTFAIAHAGLLAWEYSRYLVDVVTTKLNSCGFFIYFQPPNDFFLNGAKCGGIIAENLSQGESTLLLLGLGLNVNMTAEQLSLVTQNATSLAVASKKTIDECALRQTLIDEFLKICAAPRTTLQRAKDSAPHGAFHSATST